MWESRLSGSVRGGGTTQAKGEILWHRRETRRQTAKTNFILRPGEFPAYSKKSSAFDVYSMERFRPPPRFGLPMVTWQ